MARDGSGVHTLPVGYLAVAGQVVQPSNHNPPLEDLSNAITESIARTGVTAVTADIPFAGFRLKDVGDASAATDALNRQTADARYDARYLPILGIGLPIGTPIPVLDDTLPPLCIWADGRNVSRTTYAALFTKWGTTFGVGDGSTTFGMPDLRGRPLVGKDDLGGTDASRLSSAPVVSGSRLSIGGVVGASTHSLTGAQNGTHQHGGSTSSNSPNNPTYVGYGGVVSVQSGPNFTVPDSSTSGNPQVSGSLFHSHTFTTDNDGSGTAHNNVQQSFLCNFAIYAGA